MLFLTMLFYWLGEGALTEEFDISELWFYRNKGCMLMLISEDL